MQPVASLPRIKMCEDRWVSGKSWEECGLVQHVEKVILETGSHDGCSSLEDVTRRYARLDKVFDEVKSMGRFKISTELGLGDEIEECLGVLVHVDHENRPVFGCSGFHRLAIARILRINEIPARIGVVHLDALPFWRKRFKAASLK